MRRPGQAALGRLGRQDRRSVRHPLEPGRHRIRARPAAQAPAADGLTFLQCEGSACTARPLRGGSERRLFAGSRAHPCPRSWLSALRAHAANGKATIAARDAGDPVAGVAIAVGGRRLRTATNAGDAAAPAGVVLGERSAPGYSPASVPPKIPPPLSPPGQVLLAAARASRARASWARERIPACGRPREVRLDRLPRDEDLGRDRRVRETVGCEFGDPELGRAQLVRRRRAATRRSSPRARARPRLCAQSRRRRAPSSARRASRFRFSRRRTCP